MRSSLLPLISVIVPVFDVEDHVEACLQSLQRQSLADFEAIVVDDGSRDASRARAEAVIAGDPRFRLIAQENAGLSAARNAGLAQARGQFIAFLDSDDRLAPDFLARMHGALTESGADWVACGIRFLHPDGTSRTHSAIHGDEQIEGGARLYPLDDWCAVIRHFPSTWNKLYRRELIEGLHFDEGTYFEDHAFFYQVAARTRALLHLPEALYLQTRGRSGQITAEDSDRVFEQFAVLDRIAPLIQSAAKTHGDQAYARIASRLLFERSVSLRNPQRRARYLEVARAFLAGRGLHYQPEWDLTLPKAFALELAGRTPLSIVIPWNGAEEPLRRTLTALQDAPLASEVLIVCDDVPEARANALLPLVPQIPVRVLRNPGRGEGAARNAGLDAARGDCIVFLDAGDCPKPGGLAQWLEEMLRSESDFGLSQFRLGIGGAEVHNGFHDMAGTDPATLRNGPMTLASDQAAKLHAHPSAKIFRTEFLRSEALRFGTGALGSWRVTIGAALRAKRVSYCAWPAVAIALDPPARQVLARAERPDRLLAEIQDIGRSIPETALMTPDWPRRLFARALWEQASFAACSAAQRKRLALMALPGLLRLQAPVGVFDPHIPPRIRALCSVDGMQKIGGVVFASGLSHNDADPLASGMDRTHMQSFPVTRYGLLACRLNFHEAPYTNLSFFRRGSDEILFHISLRADEGLVVCNARSAEPEGWGAEIRRKVVLHRDRPQRLELEIKPPQIRVRLDGQEIFRFGGWRGRRFRKLDQIERFDLHGAVPAAALDLAVPLDPATGASGLWLSHRLELRAAADAATARFLDARGQDIDALPAPIEAGSGLRLMLPGRVWQYIPEGSPLQLTLQADGKRLPLRLTREDLAQQISARLAVTDLGNDLLAATQILEHVRFAGLWSRLSPLAQRAVASLATQLRLEAFLWPEGGPESPPPPPKPDLTSGGPEAHERHVSRTLGRFAEARRRDPGTDPAQLLPDLGLSGAALAEACIALSEVFCLSDRAEALFDYAKDRGLPAFAPKGEGWHDSAILPFLLLQGDLDRLDEVLWHLVEDRESWLVTSAIGWTVRRALRDPRLDVARRDKVIYAYLALIDRRQPEYWERVPCRALIEAGLSLIEAGAHLPDYLRRQTEETLLRAYGLQPEFWRGFAQRAERAGPQMQVAAKAFAALVEGGFGGPATPAQIDALHLFESLGASGATRLRREILGPAGLPARSDSAFLAEAARAGLDPAEAGIRHFSFPNEAEADPALCGLVREALMAQGPKVSHAPFYRLQHDLGARLAALVQQAKTRAPDTDEFASHLQDLRPLASHGSGYLGLALAIRLAVLVAEHPAASALCCDWLQAQLSGRPADVRNEIAAASSVRAALHRARGTAVESQLAALFGDIAKTEPLPASENPIFDTLVTVFSCQPNLATRIPAMREGWLSALRVLGVPYVVVVGGATGAARQDGDVLHLPCPDDYEGLPQKTLATIDWVRRNTGFGYLLKIDDDCFLNAAEYFHSLSHLKFDYYGRKLTRVTGQMDRAWHNAKSQSARGRLELDKSAEPSLYCDGGSGYALSRAAMDAVARAAASPEGRALIQRSFMEDKMLGDLLALEGIAPADEDYRITVRRRENPAGLPVPRWVNGFNASACNPVKLVHLDRAEDQAPAQRQLLEAPGLWPKKIWPSYLPAHLSEDCNALELISPAERLEAVRNAEVAVVACMRNEMFMLPQFLAHYRAMGVGAFLIADNCSDDGTLEYLEAQPDVSVFSVDTAYRLSHYGVAWQQALLAAFRVGRWSLVADADELLVWRADLSGSLPELLRSEDFADADAARVFMLDMYPRGSLEQVDFRAGAPFEQACFIDREPFLETSFGQGPYSNAPTWTSAVRHRLIPGSRRELFVAQKLALLKYHPLMRLSAGLHYGAGMRVARRELLFGHFKYNADFRRKAQAETARRQHFNGAEEYQKYLALVSEGRDVLYEEGLSVHWTEASFVRARLDGLKT
ncbi:glycosyltransferase [Pseudothioclava arenosa]|uniref:glycosyltransferase n=1 Tax=Pseudothioclava arenosa TaxID=1795308 RepID=UPI0015CA30B5|nr:glycosyltransferase [Pseudothioclava arenosa]